MSAVAQLDSPLLDAFSVPTELEATLPAEMRGLERDDVRLMTANAVDIRHRRFSDLPDVLTAGDIVVVNNSATIPAAVVVDDETVVHFSTELPGGLRVVEIRRIHGNRTLQRPGVDSSVVHLPGNAELQLLAPYPIDSRSRRLWVANLDIDIQLTDYLNKFGRPITYNGAMRGIPLHQYQTVFGKRPGSSEMPSAGRPFSDRLLAELIGKGIGVSTLTLHTGVSSLETGERPYAEWYEVSQATADNINAAHARGSKVVAVGTTVVRAMATVADRSGFTHPGSGWTEVVITPETELPTVSGLITGWHEPRSSHLDMLRAIADREVLEKSYRMALDYGYLWHEFGDSHLLMR